MSRTNSKQNSAILSQIKNVLTAPKFDDEEKTRTANLLNTIVLSLFLIMATLGVVVTLFVFRGFEFRAYLILTLCLALVGIYVLMRLRYTQLAGVLLVLVMWGGFTVGLFVLGGIRVPAFAIYVVITLIAGILLGARGGFVTAGLCAITGVGLFYAEAMGVVHYSAASLSLAAALSINIAILVMVAVLVHLYAGQINQTLAQARRSQRALARGNRELLAEVSERKQAETALRAQAHLNEQILQTMLDGFILADTEGQLLQVNPAYCALMGYSEAELLQMNIRELEVKIPPAEVERRIEQMVSQGADRFESQHRRKDGQVIDLDVSIVIIQTGAAPLVAAFVHDITERKQTEAALRQRAQELTALNTLGRQVSASLSLDQVVLATMDQIGLAVSPDLALFFLREGDRLTLKGSGPPQAKYAHQETPVHRVGECLCGLAVSQRQPIYSSDIHCDPRCTWEECKQASLHSFAALPLSGRDEIIGVLGLASATERDFSRQSAFLEILASQIAVGLQNALLYERAQHHAGRLEVLHEIGQAILEAQSPEEIAQATLGRVQNLVPFVRASVAIFDFAANEATVLAAHSQTMVGAGTRSPLDDPWLDMLRQGEVYVIEDFQNLPQASPVAQALLAEGVRAYLDVPLIVQGELIGTFNLGTGEPGAFRQEQIEIAREVASPLAIAIQQARLHEQVERHVADLEQRVAERTAELAVAKERAEAADRLKSAFLATMSHELRTPLNSIIGFVGIMLQGLVGPLNEEQIKQLGMVRGSARHLLDLINDVLDLSKIEAGQLKIASEPFDMAIAIEAVAQTVIPLAEQKGLALTIKVAPEVNQITGDRRRVEQILLNLFNNAIKFTEQGEVRLECQTGDDWLVTRVVDTGIGIRPEDMDSLFEPFQQIETGLARRHEGTGLGLSICKKLVEMMGGEIQVESKWGAGTTFTFTLPL